MSPTPGQEEVIRRQLTPIALPLVEMLQLAEISAKNIKKAQGDVSADIKSFQVWLSESLEHAKESTAKHQQGLDQYEKALKALIEQSKAWAAHNERMLRIPAEPSVFWWGVFLGCGIGSAATICAYLYLRF